VLLGVVSSFWGWPVTHWQELAENPQSYLVSLALMTSFLITVVSGVMAGVAKQSQILSPVNPLFPLAFTATHLLRLYMVYFIARMTA
jgi:hypothetical protein